MYEHTLNRLGCPIYYQLHGDITNTSLPLIVFTHGAGCDHRMFDAQLPALAGRFWVLTWDVRGHGLSRPMGDGFSLRLVTADLMAILDEIGCAQAIFAGQSMGGNVSQEVVRLHPERVKSLVLIDCVCNMASLSAFERFAVKLTPVMLKLYPYDTLLRQSAKAAARKPAVQQYVYEAMRLIPKDDIVTILTEVTGVLRDDPTYRIPKPFLLVRGEHDNAGAIKKQAEPWSKREPNCVRYVVIPDAGHCANQYNTAAFNQTLMAFLDE